MKRVSLLCLLLAAAAAAPLKGESPAAASTSSRVDEILDEALAERPKKARQLFPNGTFKRSPRRLKQSQAEDQTNEADVERKEKQLDGEALGQELGWSPIALRRRPAGGRSLSAADTDTTDSGSGETSDDDDGGDISGETPDSVSGDDGDTEDREAENSYLSPLYAPAPGGLAGGYGDYGGYGGHGPYIYILPIVLPPAGHHRGPAARHVVTETGHESHHYSGGGHGQYQPVYAGSHGVPPIYIPKGYGVHGGRGLHHGGHGVHGKHGGHTTVHHEDKTIIRDIDPPIFKA